MNGGRRAHARRILIVLAGLAMMSLASGSAGGQVAPTRLALDREASVLLIEVDGAITPIVADYVEDAVAEAELARFQLLIISLDTPGGLDVSMREIVQALLNAGIPTAVYVSPEGARAASAGTFITMAANVAAMAPATAIGAATPVDLQGGEITDKIINDAVAFAVSVAEHRGRNVEFAEASVREGTSVSSREAVASGVVDLIAVDLDDLLLQIDGLTIEPLGMTLSTAGSIVERRELGPVRGILGRIADPNLAFIFLSIGTLAVIYEAANPGLGFSGIAGVIMLILAFFALSVLPVQAAGIALFVLAVALLVAELFVPGVGVLAGGGAVALLLSGLFLFQEGTVRVSPVLVWPSALVLGAASFVAGRAALVARRRPPTTGAETLVGRMVRVKVRGGRDTAFLDGTWWDLESRQHLIDGSEAKVVATDGIRLVVEEVPDDV
jgi:membrane-bound serine protease (ClpP class)